MDERPERPERDAPEDFSDWTRAELVDYCQEADAFLREAFPVLTWIRETMETPVDDLRDSLVRWRCEMQDRRNKKLKERIDQLESEKKELKQRAVAAELDAFLRSSLQRERALKAEKKVMKLKQENAKLRREIDGPEQTDSERLARAVAEGHRNGEHWASGAELKRWLAERFPFSESTVERRLDDAGLWVRPGRKGKAAIQETVERCIGASA
jgi:predicted RNase H-like nuclease (RuvC/YqgF family)